MNLFDRIGFKLVEKDIEPVAYVRHGKSVRAFVFIAGFNQSAESWLEMVNQISREHTIAVLIRRQEDKQANHWLGWMSLGSQQKEVLSKLLYLKRHDLANKKLTLVGHSVGALLARHCLVSEPIRNCTERLVQINPVPLTWWGFTFNIKLWLFGGLLTIPSAILALLCLTRGFSPPKVAVSGLFARGVSANLREYYQSLVPDSTLVFLQLVIWYNGTKEWKMVRRAWTCPSYVVLTPEDPVIGHLAATDIWESDPVPMSAHLTWLQPNTPHCFWLGSEEEKNINMARLRAIIEG